MRLCFQTQQAKDPLCCYLSIPVPRKLKLPIEQYSFLLEILEKNLSCVFSNCPAYLLTYILFFRLPPRCCLLSSTPLLLPSFTLFSDLPFSVCKNFGILLSNLIIWNNLTASPELAHHHVEALGHEHLQEP